jgi:alanine-glyoxylate transaminase/serine-glyoxylate transaminase/serine-pyruvate transaminase
VICGVIVHRVFKGKAWRIGLMGAGSTRRNVTLVLSALETILADAGFALDRGAALAATANAYAGGLSPATA